MTIHNVQLTLKFQVDDQKIPDNQPLAEYLQGLGESAADIGFDGVVRREGHAVVTFEYKAERAPV